MKRIYFLIVAMFLCAGAVSAQPRPVEASSQLPMAPFIPAPASFEAKYEGGMFGYSEKEVGMLKFDDENQRLVFFGKDQKEKFHVPYKSLLVIYPQSKSVTSTTGQVVQNIPLPGSMLGGLIKEKRRYLVIHFSDPDVEAATGLVNFKLDNKELLDSVIHSLAGKANLTQRGEAYYRPKKHEI
ncbi:MAG: hypothetical protein ABI481_10690 [Pyrinomonadaceae bacterium]